MNITIVTDIKGLFNNISNKFKDTSSLWKRLETELRKTATEEFTTNANEWESLKPKTLDFKSKKGFPSNIGVMTGNLKKAATDSAIVKITPNTLQYSLNNELDKGYFKFFNKKRPLFQHLSRESNNIFEKETRIWANEQAGKI